jgi:hypothetical protein
LTVTVSVLSGLVAIQPLRLARAVTPCRITRIFRARCDALQEIVLERLDVRVIAVKHPQPRLRCHCHDEAG